MKKNRTCRPGLRGPRVKRRVARSATAALRRAAGIVLVALAFSGAGPMPSATAQQLANTLGGFSSDPNAPIDIEADRLDVDDAKRTATFKGSVKAVQGDFVLRSKILIVHYTGSARATGTAQGGSQVKRLEAREEVLITSKDDRTATADWADFDVKTQIVIIGGNVVLTQGKNIIKGERLIVDLQSGRSHFEASETAAIDDSGERKNRRVRMLITRRPDAAAAPAAPAASATAPASATASASPSIPAWAVQPEPETGNRGVNRQE